MQRRALREMINRDTEQLEDLSQHALPLAASTPIIPRQPFPTASTSKAQYPDYRIEEPARGGAMMFDFNESHHSLLDLPNRVTTNGMYI